MSHHFSGPNLAFPGGDARLNFTDLFAFPKAGDNNKSILIMNVHPSIGVNPRGPTTTVPFSTTALYEIMIDTDGDAVANIAYSVRFSASKGDAQTATLRRVEGAPATGLGENGQVILKGAPVSMGQQPTVTNAGDYRFFAGWRSDPFFFDAVGAVNNLHFTGSDFFVDKNVCSIVLEVPNAQLGSQKLGLWCRVLDSATGSWVQVDRGARPSQAPFLAGDALGAYIAAEPAGDAQFIAPFAHSLEHTGGYTPDQARQVAITLLPDMLSFVPARQASFPNNGRALTDDAAAHFLSVISNGKVTGDGLTAHHDLSADFPYAGPPHNLG
jgi:hypothetical protein